MKKSVVLIICLFLFCLFFSCDPGRKENILEKFIPPDALVIVQVRNPDTFFENLDAFFEPLGGIPLMGNIPVKDLLKSMLGQSFPLKFEWFDFSRPWGGALLPSDNLVNDFSILICIPVLQTADIEEFKKQVLSVGIKESKVSDGYILLFNTINTDKTTKTDKENIDLSLLSKFDKGALACQVNTGNLLKATGLSGLNGLDSQLIKTMIKSNLFSSEKIKSNTNSEMGLDFLVKLFEAAEQVERISAGILLNENGISITTITKIADQGWVHDCFSPLTLNSGIKDYLKYIPAKYTFSLLSNLNDDFLSGIIERCFAFILAHSEIDAQDAKALIDAYKQSIYASGRKTAMAFDIDNTGSGDFINTEQPIPQEMKFLQAIGSSISFSFLSGIEIKNKKAYRSALKEICSSNVLTSIINSFFNTIFSSKFDSKIENTPVLLSIKYNQGIQKDDITYDELEYGIDFSPDTGMDMGESGYEDMKKKFFYLFLKEFFERFNLYMGFSTKRCYVVSHDSGIENLKNFLKNDEYGENNILSTDVYSRFSTMIPKDAHFIGHLSIPGIISLIPEIPKIDKKPGFLFYGKYKETLFETGCYWDIGEISILYNQYFTLIPQLLDDAFAF